MTAPPANGIRIITRAGLRACIWEDWNHDGFVIASAWSTQVEAFWSKSDQNGVMRKKSTSTRSTERTPSTASSG